MKHLAVACSAGEINLCSLLARMTLRILLLLAAALCICNAQGGENQASDCCLSHRNKQIPLNLLVSYKLQGPETGCRIPAVVFITKKKRNLCAPPTAQWARNLMEKLDKKSVKALAQQSGKKGQPNGLKPKRQRKPQQ